VICRTVRDNNLREGESPIIALKAAKNPVELDGMRSCHIRDGAAMAEFLSWLDSLYKDDSSSTRIDEFDIDIYLTEKRKELSPAGWFVDRSFPTIAGVFMTTNPI